MDKFTDLLIQDQKTALGNCYVINDDSALVQIISNGEVVTSDNFNIVIVSDDNLYIATAEDISFYKPENYDFDFRVGECYFCREDTPDDVLTMLDEYLGKDNYDDGE